MSVNIYPAIQIQGVIEHADNWDDNSTVNIANGNFYSMVDTMGISHLADVPGTMKLRDMESALASSPPTHYTERLKKICAIARIKRAHLIAFS